MFNLFVHIAENTKKITEHFNEDGGDDPINSKFKIGEVLDHTHTFPDGKFSGTTLPAASPGDTKPHTHTYNLQEFSNTEVNVTSMVAKHTHPILKVGK